MDQEMICHFLLLPPEIRRMVFDYMDNAELIILCRTSKQIRLETEHRLYRHVKWSVAYGTCPTSDRISFLLEHILRRPKVATWIEVIEIDEESVARTKGPHPDLSSRPVPDSVHDIAIAHLQAIGIESLSLWKDELMRSSVEASFAVILLLAVNVRRFVLRAFYLTETHADQTQHVSIMFLLRHLLRTSSPHACLQRLESIELLPNESVNSTALSRSKQPSNLDLMGLMKLPKIEAVFTAFDEFSGNTTDPIGRTLEQSRGSNLTDLDLRWIVPNLQQLSILLSSASRLKNFYIEMLHDDSCFRGGCHCFDLLGLSQALQPCRDSLEHLLVLCYEGGTVGTPVFRTSNLVCRAIGSLTDFTKLNKLEISAAGLLGRDHDHSFATVLPSSIRYINLILDAFPSNHHSSEVCGPLIEFSRVWESHTPEMKRVTLFNNDLDVLQQSALWQELQTFDGFEVKFHHQIRPAAGWAFDWDRMQRLTT